MRPHTRMLVAGVIVPLVIAAAAVVAMLVSLPALPDPVAVHWGPSGEADQFGTPIGFLLLVPIAVLAYSAFAFAVIRGSDTETVNQRILLAIAPFFATVLSVMGAGGLLMQRGLADAHDSPSILPIVAFGFGGGVVLAVAAWFFLPAATPIPELAQEELPRLDLAAQERATWSRRIEPARWLGILLVVIGAIVVVGGGVAVWIGAPAPVLVVYLVIVIVLVVASVGSLFWTVRVDSRGFVARSVLGVPRFTVPIEDVAGAASIEASPLNGFGGWGLRWGGPGRIGIILGTGRALEVRRKSGGSVTVTTADSERAAALLNSLAVRA